MRKKNPPFIMVPHAIYDSPAWKTLLPIDIAVLLVLIRKHNGYNNGGIPLGIREVAKRLRCGPATAGRALNNLQVAGLISATYKGHLVPEIGRSNVATRWRLNYLTIDKPQPVIVEKAEAAQ
jgi:DNA-binding IclR family transcriptional regulator